MGHSFVSPRFMRRSLIATMAVMAMVAGLVLVSSEGKAAGKADLVNSIADSGKGGGGGGKGR
jgi:hypothetical protein